jgi:ribonuclease HI
VHIDGAWGLIGARIATILTSLSSIKLRYAVRLEFQCINNNAEYEAIILALSKLRALLARRTIIKIDCQVIFGHIEKTLKARDIELQKYLLTVCKIEGFFLRITTKPIPRTKNNEVDELAKAVAQGTSLPSDVFYEIISQPSVEVNFKAPKLINAIHSKDWRAPIMAYLKGYHELETKEEEKRMQQRVRGYKIINGELYKTSVIAPLLKCITISKGKQLLKEIHEGFCGSDNGPRALVGKAFRQGFYWPTAVSDVASVVQHYEGCQLSTSHSNRPGAPTTLICPTWPLQ